MSGHGTQPVPKTSQGGAGPTGGARPRRPPESAHKPAGTGASSIPSDGKSLISSKIHILLFQCMAETKSFTKSRGIRIDNDKMCISL